MAVGAHSETTGNGVDNQEQSDAVDCAHTDAQRICAPPACSAPNCAVPESLGEKDSQKNRRHDGDPQQKPTPIHIKLTILVTSYFSMPDQYSAGLTIRSSSAVIP
jgi:hypothetical protein